MEPSSVRARRSPESRVPTIDPSPDCSVTAPATSSTVMVPSPLFSSSVAAFGSATRKVARGENDTPITDARTAGLGGPAHAQRDVVAVLRLLDDDLAEQRVVLRLFVDDHLDLVAIPRVHFDGAVEGVERDRGRAGDRELARLGGRGALGVDVDGAGREGAGRQGRAESADAG